MLIGFSKHSSGSGYAPVNYMIAKTYKGEDRIPPPVVLRGNPTLIRKLIDSLEFEHTYSSLVLSFAPGETITPEMENDILDRFETATFSGLNKDEYAWMAVRHEHAGHHEIHILTPRVHLPSGKSFNIKPPGRKSEAFFDAFRSMINAEYGLADPDDPARSQAISLPNHIAKLHAAAKRSGGDKAKAADIREVITANVSEQVLAGAITDRQGIERYLEREGYTITRSGADYISLSGASERRNIRLKGGIYSQERFDAVRASLGQEQPIYDRPNPELALKHAETLARMVASRAEFNRTRYPNPEREADDGRMPPEDLGEYLDQMMGEDAIHPTPEALAEVPSIRHRQERLRHVSRESEDEVEQQRGYV